VQSFITRRSTSAHSGAQAARASCRAFPVANFATVRACQKGAAQVELIQAMIEAPRCQASLEIHVRENVTRELP